LEEDGESRICNVIRFCQYHLKNMAQFWCEALGTSQGSQQTLSYPTTMIRLWPHPLPNTTSCSLALELKALQRDELLLGF
jgi:hypothetical protein